MSPTFTRTLPPGGLVEHLTALLGALYGRCRGVVSASVGRGTAAQEYRTQAADLGGELLPEWIVRELAYDPPDEIRLSLATASDTGEVLDLGAVWAVIAREAIFGAVPGEGWVWRLPPEIIAAVDARLAAFPLAPSILIDAENLIGLWLLDRPARLDDPAERARVERLQRGLVDVLGGQLDDVEVVPPVHGTREPGVLIPTTTWPSWYPARPGVLPLPGSRVRECGDGPIVILEQLAVSPHVTLDDLEAALAPSMTPTRKGRTSHVHV